MEAINLSDKLAAALDTRAAMLDESHLSAVRLFNGFSEGCPDLAVDLYARTLVLFNYAEHPAALESSLLAVKEWYLEHLPWLQAVLVKTRHARSADARAGLLVYGHALDDRVQEGHICYALDLRLNQDASFYIDTRDLRAWLKANMAGKRLLNTFAYTGSLGAAALAGGARKVLQTDRTARFLDLARQTYALNDWPVNKRDFIVGDFYHVTAGLKGSGALFDCVILDPPFFSAGPGAKVDTAADYPRLVNKIRPLVAHGGWIVAVNNALFVRGVDYLASLEALCAGGYLQIERLLPVPLDCCGYPETIVSQPPVDPVPFNHPTKIAILRVSRKDERTE
jgi:23S rRNA (cytosine1962-C5)-methyltransferase